MSLSQKLLLLTGLAIVDAGVSTIVAGADVRLISTNIGPSGSSIPSSSADGRFVAYDTDFVVVVVDRDTDTDGVFDEPSATSYVLIDGDCEVAASEPDLSADGRYLAYACNDNSSPLPPPPANLKNIYRLDRSTGTRLLLSTQVLVSQEDDYSWGFAGSPAISADGFVVAYLVGGADLGREVFTNGFAIWVAKINGGVTTYKISSDSQGDSYSAPAISADGRFVVFSRYDPASEMRHVYVYDLATDSEVVVDKSTSGAIGNASAGVAVDISADGRYVTFSSNATNLVSDDTNSAEDVFRRDLVAGETIRVSVRGATEGDGASEDPSISDDGKLIAFRSDATNWFPDGGSGVFLAEPVAQSLVRASSDTGGGPPDGYSQHTGISGDGAWAFFNSVATDLVSPSTSGDQIFGFRTACTPSSASTCGDANCDGSVNFFDIDVFILALFDLPSYQATYCGGATCTVDVNRDGSVDFFDSALLEDCLGL